MSRLDKIMEALMMVAVFILGVCLVAACIALPFVALYWFFKLMFALAGVPF